MGTGEGRSRRQSAGRPTKGYFQYAHVPGLGEHEFGWSRGGPGHFVSRYHQGRGHRARSRVRWGDRVGGQGELYFEYNHGPQAGRGFCFCRD